MIYQLLIGLILASLIALLAYLTRVLSASGLAAAILVGTVIFGLGGLPWAILLLAFFISSSALSHLAGRSKTQLQEKIAKGSRRDASQVLANGGVAVLILLGLALTRSGFILGGLSTSFSQALLVGFKLTAIDHPLVFVAFAASLAAANADTWSTEIGVLSKSLPVLVTTGQPVERGTSGGISNLGVLAGLGGSALIALLAAGMLWSSYNSGLSVGLLGTGFTTFGFSFVLVTAGGLFGSWVDSLLGATLQVIYSCPSCLKETERHPYHSCGARTSFKRGWRWLNNDWVNVICTASGALVVLMIGFLAQI